MSDVLRKLARDQWVRLHGTPRVTVLAGAAHARRLWDQWLALCGVDGKLLDGDVDASIRDAVASATAKPAQPIAVLATEDAIARWRANRRDRLAAMLDEGLIAIDERADGSPAIETVKPTAAARRRSKPAVAERTARAKPPLAAVPAMRAAVPIDARSVAEATLFEALEGTRSTAGRFRLNESLSVRFGPAAAEIDLLSRTDRIAIEIDGFHHFADPECYRRDRRKDLLMQTQGLIVIRLLAEDVVRDVRAAVNVVVQALAYRLGER